MLVKSIELSNFKIFSGNHVVDFSTDDEKSVTVIMGDNGAGKTTFAQAFSWCLYGKTTFKRSNDLLSFSVRDELIEGKSATVKVRLTLIHNEREYRITRSQEYRKDSPAQFHPESAILSISYKAPDGQDEFIDNESEKRDLVNEIMPASVSSYFFFDGERVEKMGNEIQDGRGKEFKVAVDNLLGLSAISEAIRHLKGSPLMVIGSYNKDYNENSDEEFQRAEKEKQAADTRIAKLNEEISNLEDDKQRTSESRDKYKAELERAKETRAWASERAEKRNFIEKVQGQRQRETDALTKRFSAGAWRYFSAPLFSVALTALEKADIEIKEAPSGVNADTIKDIIERKQCLCGTPIELKSKEYEELYSWLSIVPPEHIGSAIKNYKHDCELSREGDPSSMLDDIDLHISNIGDYDDEILAAERRIKELDENLAAAKDMSNTERSYQTACSQLRNIEDKLSEKKIALGMAEGDLRDAITKRNSLTTNDETNNRVRRDREYAEFIFEEFNEEYVKKERETRDDLENEINSIFKEFFKGSLQLELDDKYNVSVKNMNQKSQAYDAETSEGQTVAVIFAFIAGVIRLATDSKRLDDEMLLTEAYPLVMDAPMSKLDKKRIAAICEVVPKIAEQTVIMIKDTDGELAREHLAERIGSEYAFVSIEPQRRSTIEKVIV